MIDAVVAKIKTGTVKNVVAFGQSSLPTPPYDVVKEEPQPDFGRTVFRVICHDLPSRYMVVRKHARKELVDLLRNMTLTSQYTGARNVVLSDQRFDGVTVNNDDKTISFERLFYVNDIF